MLRRAALTTSLLLGSVLGGNMAHASPSAPTVSECLDASEKGQQLRDDGKLSRANELFARCASSTCPQPVQTSCSKWLVSLVESMPSVVIVARNEADEDVRDATMLVDGAPVTQTGAGRSVALDPGPHTVAVTAPGYARAEEKIVVYLAEKNRLVRIRIAKATATPIVPAGATALPARTTLPETPAPSSSSSSSSIPPLAIGLGALAVVGVGASIYVGLDARGDLSDLRSSPCGAARTCDAQKTDDLRTRLVVADVLLGVGVAAAAAAIWVWLSSTPPKVHAVSNGRILRTAFEF